MSQDQDGQRSLEIKILFSYFCFSLPADGFTGPRVNTINPDVSSSLSSSVTDTISSRQDPGPDQSQEQHLDEADRWQMMKAQLSTHWWQWLTTSLGSFYQEIWPFETFGPVRPVHVQPAEPVSEISCQWLGSVKPFTVGRTIVISINSPLSSLYQSRQDNQ